MDVPETGTGVDFETIRQTRDQCVELTRKLCSLAPVGVWRQPADAPYTSASDSWSCAIDRLQQSRKDQERQREDIRDLLLSYDSNDRISNLSSLHHDMSLAVDDATRELDSLPGKEKALAESSNQCDDEHNAMDDLTNDKELQLIDTLQTFHNQIRGQIRAVVRIWARGRGVLDIVARSRGRGGGVGFGGKWGACLGGTPI